MQSACSGGTGTFIEKTARKLQIPTEQLSEMHYAGHTLHKISSKCGIFAEADANTLLKAGVTVDEIIASLFEAVVYQNLATLTRGNTPSPEVLLLGGPNLFFKGLQEAWRLHLTRIWKERKVQMPGGGEPESFIIVPKDALYYAALGCIEVGSGRAADRRRLSGHQATAVVARRRPARRKEEAGPRRTVRQRRQSASVHRSVFENGRDRRWQQRLETRARSRCRRKNWIASWWAAISARLPRRPCASRRIRNCFFPATR